ncbi:hypothetical protein [uncultured Variovorax sp.]|uniref:hypothetical protein n=1 Tax=uncultured Variovorax sp. TaxID=114708 RepID=UPI0025F84650|nr:hypothetical protein [uncultured Variovorax sp.]
MVRVVSCRGGGACRAQTPDAGKRCKELHTVANASPGFVPRHGAVVIGTGRARLYTAPDAACDIGRLLIPKDRVTVYTPFREWVQVMYIHPGTGEDTMGWMLGSRLETTGTMGPR